MVKQRKPRDFKAEYARRIERAEKAGKTRQAARGHKPQEHILRREREIRDLGLSKAQIRSIENWVLSKFNPSFQEDKPDFETILDQSRQEGYDWFKGFRKVWNDVRRKYIKDVKSGEYVSGGPQYLQMLTDLIPAPDVNWLYYH